MDAEKLDAIVAKLRNLYPQSTARITPQRVASYISHPKALDVTTHGQAEWLAMAAADAHAEWLEEADAEQIAAWVDIDALLS